MSQSPFHSDCRLRTPGERLFIGPFRGNSRYEDVTRQGIAAAEKLKWGREREAGKTINWFEDCSENSEVKRIIKSNKNKDHLK